MFGLSLTEILVVLVLGLVVLGPERIPQVAKTLGKVIREVRKASNLLRDAIMIEDAPSKPKLTARSGKAPEHNVSQTHATPPEPESATKDVLLVAMSRPRRVTEFNAVDLKPASEHEGYRDVYLHIPFQETI